MQFLFKLTIISVTFYMMLNLIACTTNQHTDPNHLGFCNALTNKIIFNGSTSNTRRSEIEQAESALQQRSYDKHCQ